jgi:hypothetical protein
MAALSRADILAADDLKTEKVKVPEWGGDVWVRTMTGLDRDRWEQSLSERRRQDGGVSLDHTRASFAVLVMCDKDGAALFELSDIEALSAKSSAALDRVIERAQMLNGMRDSDIEEAAKN